MASLGRRMVLRSYFPFRPHSLPQAADPSQASPQAVSTAPPISQDLLTYCCKGLAVSISAIHQKIQRPSDFIKSSQCTKLLAHSLVKGGFDAVAKSVASSIDPATINLSNLPIGEAVQFVQQYDPSIDSDFFSPLIISQDRVAAALSRVAVSGVVSRYFSAATSMKSAALVVPNTSQPSSYADNVVPPQIELASWKTQDSRNSHFSYHEQRPGFHKASACSILPANFCQDYAEWADDFAGTIGMLLLICITVGALGSIESFGLGEAISLLCDELDNNGGSLALATMFISIIYHHCCPAS